MTRKPWSHFRILVYRTWAIISTCLTLNLVRPVFFFLFLFFILQDSEFLRRAVSLP